MIYLDYNATTPVDPEVLETMLPFFSEKFGNPSSNHPLAWEAQKAIDKAREQIALSINAESPSTLIFTSGATEANNLALKGIAWANRSKGKHLITQKTEHEAILQPAKAQKEGFEITYLDCDANGKVNPTDIAQAIKKETLLVSIMAANNEIGTVQNFEQIGKICREQNVLFHSDAVQALGKIPFDVQKAQIDLASFSAHKVYGPKGIGALYITKRQPNPRLKPLFHGGGHERGLRSGTLAVPLIVGFGKAAEIAQKNLQKDREHALKLREELWQTLNKKLPQVYRNGDVKDSLPGTLNISFAGLDAESLLMGLSTLALTSGSACATARKEPSHVLMALGLEEHLAHAALRICIGRYTTQAEIDEATNLIIKQVKRLRALSSPQEGRALPLT